MITIRLFQEQDWPAVWRVIMPVFREGATYPFSPDIEAHEARSAWVDMSAATFVAASEAGNIVGTYYIKPNQPSLGAHVCNCGYIVLNDARKKGIGEAMCQHSQREAAARGFRAMQFNLVVSTNEGAVRLWKRCGLEIAGTLPKAFKHKSLGFVDAYVMYRQLQPPDY